VFAVLFPTWITFCSSSSPELVPNNSEFGVNTYGLQIYLLQSFVW
jgi:hypothetical protein